MGGTPAENSRQEGIATAERDKRSPIAEKTILEGGPLHLQWWKENIPGAVASGVFRTAPARAGFEPINGLVRAYRSTYNEELEKLMGDESVPKLADKRKKAKERAKSKVLATVAAEEIPGGFVPKDDTLKVNKYLGGGISGAVEEPVGGAVYDISNHLIERRPKNENEQKMDWKEFLKRRKKEAEEGFVGGMYSELLKEGRED